MGIEFFNVKFEKYGARVIDNKIVLVCWKVTYTDKPHLNPRYQWLSHPAAQDWEFHVFYLIKPEVDLVWKDGEGFVKSPDVPVIE